MSILSTGTSSGGKSAQRGRQVLSILRHVFAKEARDLLRDRRALLFLFATPLLMPLLGAIGGAFVLWQMVRQTQDGLPVVIVNG